ncbi:amidohydrolase family protein [Amycolatopsis sp. FDAARGOS 1241]|uniref:metal-dependent hydrolase family protein n=1 Tax=Amycolatopsis sp. FDAARGOS 1241 TaxID=2778070 RepID=UPI00194E4C1D|nr:amidohydrolase family protein [Amycolatopsis sp. FDAARGOS 1241]QRP43532.1 amidohydrolase family protein [Amycolatopsis sp. FDAARGOS 1241]
MAADLTVRHVSVVDPATDDVAGARAIRIAAGRITAVEPDPGGPVGAGELDGSGLFALPGLIDCHVHVNAVSAALGTVADASPAYVAAQASHLLKDMLGRGFTSVRDVGGADFGIAAAVAEGLFTGPRIFFGGKALSQTGGHGDLRPAGRDVHDQHYAIPVLGRVCDGVDEVRRAARDEIRRGAYHLKIMLSGGCASPTDRVDSLQFSDEEVTAIVEEAAAANLYTAGHAYTADAVNRGLRLGVRTIEHGNLLDATSIELFLAHDAFYVPTLITYQALLEQSRELGFTAQQYEKVVRVTENGYQALQLADSAGVRIAYGSDLLGAMQARQSEEFTLRAKVQTPGAVLRSATTVAAELLRQEGRLGTLAAGATGDVVLARANPLESLDVLANPSSGIAAVVQEGVVRVRR